MKRLSLCVGLVAALAMVIPAFAGVGSIPDNGIHYNLNIIGVPKGKTADMTDSQRHTIFVPLNTTGSVDMKGVKISYIRSETGKFEVLDGNATDADGALIAVPYEFCDDLTAGCTDLLSYNVYAVALGKPNGAAIVEAHCGYDAPVIGDDGTCESTLLQGGFDLTRSKGQPKPVDITKVFRATGCLDLGGEAGVCDAGDLAFNNIWIFNIPNLLYYFWDYQNSGLKLMQVRFYPTVSGSIRYVK
jgi:hypothetical protein